MKFSFLLIIALSFKAHAQELKLLSSIKVNPTATIIEVDQFGYVYQVIDEELQKLDAKGNIIASYSDPVWGQINQIDPLNALNPLLYYSDFNQLRILDNRLNQSQDFSFMDLGFSDPKLIAYADQNSIWVYEQGLDKLLQFSVNQGKTINASPIISSFLKDENEVLEIYAGFDQVLCLVLMQDSSKKILVFDALGAFQNAYSLDSKVQHVDYYNQEIVSLQENGLLVKTALNATKRQAVISPQSQTKKIIYLAPHLYLWSENRLHKYLWQ
jgi:hypothetical protein